MRCIAAGVALRGEELAHTAPGRHGFRWQTGCIELESAHGVVRARRQPTPRNSTLEPNFAQSASQSL